MQVTIPVAFVFGLCIGILACAQNPAVADAAREFMKAIYAFADSFGQGAKKSKKKGGKESAGNPATRDIGSGKGRSGGMQPTQSEKRSHASASSADGRPAPTIPTSQTEASNTKLSLKEEIGEQLAKIHEMDYLQVNHWENSKVLLEIFIDRKIREARAQGVESERVRIKKKAIEIVEELEGVKNPTEAWGLHFWRWLFDFERPPLEKNKEVEKE